MKIYDTCELGHAIRLRRKELGWTQGQLADYSGCSVMYLSSLERGKDTAQIGIALRVVATLGLDISITERAKECQ